MPAVRALPINQLMPAVSSYKPPAATRCLGGRPGKNERPHPSPARTPGTPSIIMSPDPRPWTQIRLGAGTPRFALFGPELLTEAPHDLNRNIFTSLRANPVCGASSSASRSFVLAALRALHLDPDLRSTALNTERK